MLDKNNDGRSQFGMDDDFHDDLGEFNPAKTPADPLNPSFDDADNFPLEEETDPNYVANGSMNPPPSGGFMETIKTYGVVVLVVLVVGYFGIKYSLRSIMPQNVNQAAQDSGNAVEPDLNTAANPIPVAPDNSSVVPSIVTTTATLPEQVAVVEPVAANQPAEVLPPTITPVNSPAANAMAGTSPEVKQDIENLKKTLDDLTQQLTVNRDLSDNSLRDIKQQVQQLVIYMQGVGKGVSILSSELTQQQKVLEGMLAGIPMPKSNNNQINAPTSNISPYGGASAQNNNVVVEAVIAGRAWIKTSNTGKTLSVGIGDVIPGYGKVIAIDQLKATITTDTGSELSLQK